MAKRKAEPDCSQGCPLDESDLALCEEQLRQLVRPGQTLQWCERCKIPVEAIKRDYEALVDHFTTVLANSRGQQSKFTGGPGL